MATSRREFFKTATGLVVGFNLVDSAIVPRLMALGTAAPPVPGELDTWLRIEQSGAVKVFTGKVDIGMGVRTCLTQVMAEELDVPLHTIELIMGDTANTPDQGGVGGSNAISVGAKPMRNAAATARFLLVQMASDKLGVPVEDLQVKDGIVSSKSDPSKRISYGELAHGTEFHDALKVSGKGNGVNVQGQGKPKDPATYTVVGKSVPRFDLEEKFFGRSLFATDVRMDGMLHARVIRPPSAGATFVSFDEASVKNIRGFVKVVVKGNFVGVVTETEWSAVKAARALKIKWNEPGDVLPADLYAYIRSVAPKATRQGPKKGDAAAVIASAPRKMEASYDWPFQAHATMGPGCAVAQYSADGVSTIWCGAQKPHALQVGIAQMLNVSPDMVRIVWVEDSGSYGRAGFEDVAADAVLLSQAMGGKPVRVQWTRADMTQWGGKGPPISIDVSADLDEKGTVTALQFTSRCVSGADIQPQPTTAGNLLAAQLMGIENKGADEFLQWGNDTEPYVFPSLHSVGHNVPVLYPLASPLRTTHLRDPNGPAGGFASESFMDELAAAAQEDPVEFRMRYLENPRAKATLKAAAERANWDTRPSPKRGPANGDIVTGRGIALGLRGGTHVATFAEIELNRKTGAIRVKRLVCAHDCGLIVNPDALRGTIAANLMQSLSRALKEEVTFDRNKVTSIDWNSYPIARWSDVPPQVEIVMLNPPNTPSSGAGEPSTRPTAPAIANAIFDATGVRLRQVPLTPAKIKAGLAKV